MQSNQRHMPKSFVQAVAPIVFLILSASFVLIIVHLAGG